MYMGRSTLLAACLFFCSGGALGEETREDPPPPSPPMPAPAPAPYSLPWQLRSVVPAHVVRSDTALASYREKDALGVTAASMLYASFKLSPEVAPFLRVAAVGNAPPGGSAALSLANPLLGIVYGARATDEIRFVLSLAATVPIGMGGGDQPDPATASATRAGVLARSAMDSAMFAVNDLAILPGVGMAWVADGATVQIEATLIELVRVRGESVQPDFAKTNFASGLHVGYFVLPVLSLGAELRYQRWLMPPAAVAADATGALADTLSVAVGLRGHFKLGNIWLRPGLAYARGVDAPMTTADYHVVQVDVPIVF
jgi:hypothetical protein